MSLTTPTIVTYRGGVSSERTAERVGARKQLPYHRFTYHRHRSGIEFQIARFKISPLEEAHTGSPEEAR